MNKLITDHLALWTTAPKGIKKLRGLILELAVRGLLVLQEPNDEPASELLKKIAAEKARLISEGKIKKQSPLPKISEQEKPFVLPDRWEWVRISTFTQIGTGSTPSRSNPLYYSPAEISWVTSGETQQDFIFETREKISPLALKETNVSIYPTGSLVVAMYGQGKTRGQVSELMIEAGTNQACAVIQFIEQSEAHRKYIKLFFKKAYEELRSNAVGGAQPNLNVGKITLTVVPLPPLPEQHRIVAKVDELMQLCDQLEYKQSDSQQSHRQLVSCLLGTLTETTDPQAFQTAWSLIAANFDSLFTTENSIEQLKQTILQLAVMGKLVPQNPSDEPASELLKKIAAEKARLITEGKIKKQNPLPKISEQEKPFVLPDSWEWIRLGDISADIHYGYTASSTQNITGVKLLRITDIQNDAVNWLTVPSCEIEQKNVPTYQLENGDLLIARTGGTIGKSYLVENINDCSVFASYLIRIKRLENIYPTFIKTYLGSQLYWNQLYANSMGTGQPNVNGNALKNLVCAFPPLPEQRRIVAKVDELMSLCEQLKTKLAATQTLQQQLAETLVQQAVA